MRTKLNTLAYQSSLSHWKLEKLVHISRTCSERETFSGFYQKLGKNRFRVKTPQFI